MSSDLMKFIYDITIIINNIINEEEH